MSPEFEKAAAARLNMFNIHCPRISKSCISVGPFYIVKIYISKTAAFLGAFLNN
jgi:hypothetical protein